MSMKILVVDIGGTNVKMLASGKDARRKFPSGRELTPEKMVDGVLAATRKRHGRKKWQSHVEEVVERLIAALKPDDVVIGGGNVKKLKGLPPGTRAGDNANAFLGGFRLWHGEAERPQPSVTLPTEDRLRK
jgi:predicted NBD/HSP70 family sugar kinase